MPLRRPLLLFVAVTALFYALLQHQAGWSRLGLAARSALLFVVFVAEPVLVFRSTSKPRPYLWLLFDGTDSMAIQDELTDSERRELEDGLGLRQPRDARSAASPSASTVATTANPTAAGSRNAAGGSTASAANPAALPDKPSRQDYVQAMLAVRDDNVLRSLEDASPPAFCSTTASAIADPPRAIRGVAPRAATKGAVHGSSARRSNSPDGRPPARQGWWWSAISMGTRARRRLRRRGGWGLPCIRWASVRPPRAICD